MIKLFSKFFNWFRLFYKKSHKYKINKSYDVLDVLKKISLDGSGFEDQRAFSYLRKINPNVFEELALTMFENSGFFILRNTRYTNDGGIDGMVRIPGFGFVPIQSKRYNEYIKMEHVKEFNELLVTRRKKIGFFIHTGKTGKKTKLLQKDGRVIIISGSDYIKCLMGKASLIDYLSTK